MKTATTNATKPPLTEEQKRERYACALDDTMQDVNEQHEKLKKEFRATAEQSGYDYAARWQLEGVVVAEHKATYMAAVIAMLRQLIEGEQDIQTTRANMLEYRNRLAEELVRMRPWEHHCTCAITNVTCLWQATAKAESVEMIDQLLRHALKE